MARHVLGASSARTHPDTAPARTFFGAIPVRSSLSKPVTKALLDPLVWVGSQAAVRVQSACNGRGVWADGAPIQNSYAKKKHQDDEPAGRGAAARPVHHQPQRHPEFSSVIDLLRGAVGNNTALGKQLTNIRKQATRQSSRSASNVIDVNAIAKKAA